MKGEAVTAYYCRIVATSRKDEVLEQAIANSLDDVVAWLDEYDDDTFPRAVQFEIEEIGVVQ